MARGNYAVFGRLERGDFDLSIAHLKRPKGPPGIHSLCAQQRTSAIRWRFRDGRRAPRAPDVVSDYLPRQLAGTTFDLIVATTGSLTIAVRRTLIEPVLGLRRRGVVARTETRLLLIGAQFQPLTFLSCFTLVGHRH